MCSKRHVTPAVQGNISGYSVSQNGWGASELRWPEFRSQSALRLFEPKPCNFACENSVRADEIYYPSPLVRIINIGRTDSHSSAAFAFAYFWHSGMEV